MRIAYVDIPGVIEHEVVAPVEDLTLSRISVGARVWVQSKPYGWLAGEITGHAGFEEYYVRIVGLSRDIRMPAAKFVIRWNRPLSDAVSAVAHGLCDSPEYYEAREAFLRQLVLQRRVSRGLVAAVSAPIEFYQHQLDTVARVLADPVLRYLLADEVGLGKTIEAGLILRQLLLDDAQATALVIVPSALVGQWRAEIQDRLLLRDALLEGRLRLIPHEAVVAEVELSRHALVVVDEAHQMLRILNGNDALRRGLLDTKGLLLLSATPMRGNPSAFLQMLNLVDPLAFPLDRPNEFRARLNQRERQAADLQVLVTRRASLRQRASVLNDLEKEYADDHTVVAVVAACRATEDLEASCWGELVDYVRETYRISRRMIRNRRNSGLTDDYPVSGRRKTLVPVEDPARQLVDDFLEQYRDQLAGRPLQFTYARAVLNGLAGPRALLLHLERQLSGSRRGGAVAEYDRPLLEATAARLRMIATAARQEAALALAADRLTKGLKVVAISTSQVVAQEFFTAAVRRWPGLVGSHLVGQKPAQLEEDVATFLGDARGRVLVGDQTIEEGRNLQDAHVLLNLDLPLDPNRLEQRIGRLDRFARRTDPAEIIVLTEPGNDWVTAHVRLLDEGIGIFDASVATLQRKLSEVVEELVQKLLPGGIDAFDFDIPTLRDNLAEEQIDIDLLEELESVAGTSDIDNANLTDLRAVDNNTVELRTAFRRLTSMRGGLGLRPQEDVATHLLQFGARDGRRVHGLSDDEAGILRSLLIRPKAYAREVVTSRAGVAPLRIGDPLVDWLERHVRNDERGRARAILRPSTAVRQPHLWLACDFLVEFDAVHLHAETDAIRRRIRRRGDALLAPRMMRTWTDADGPAADALIADQLDPPYDERTDRVVRGQLWGDVLRTLPDWREWCRLSGEAARAQVGMSPTVTADTAAAEQRARAEVQSRCDVLRARSRRLPSAAERQSALRELGREQALGQALIDGVESPSISIVACGAVVLWPVS